MIDKNLYLFNISSLMSLERSIHPGNISTTYAVNVQGLEQENYTTLLKYIKKYLMKCTSAKLYCFLAIGFAHFCKAYF